MAKQVVTSSATMWSQFPEEQKAALREQVRGVLRPVRVLGWKWHLTPPCRVERCWV